MTTKSVLRSSAGKELPQTYRIGQCIVHEIRMSCGLLFLYDCDDTVFSEEFGQKRSKTVQDHIKAPVPNLSTASQTEIRFVLVTSTLRTRRRE